MITYLFKVFMGVIVGLVMVSIIVGTVNVMVSAKGQSVGQECKTSVLVYKDGDPISATNPRGNSTERICLDNSSKL